MNSRFFIGVCLASCACGTAMGFWLTSSASESTASPSSKELFPVAIVHINDFHARYEETNEKSNTCRKGQKCIGGYARAVALIKKMLDTQKASNPIYLNAGDNFQGTLWYNIGRWNVTSYFLNMLKADAITLGNHEFDHNIAGVVPYLEALESPVVAANIDDSEEPTIQGKYRKSIIIDRYSRKIGVIGVVLSTFSEIVDAGKLKFTNESEAVRKEAAKLKRQGVDIIIVLSHCGLEVDYEIAKYAGPDIDVIVGGHSHYFLYTGPNAPGPDKVIDDYPVVVTQSDGHKVLIIATSEYLKYVGNLTVYFDAEGNVDSWQGAPIFMDSNLPKDETIVKEMKPWKDLIDENDQHLAESKVMLDRTNCQFQECNIGSFLCDAYVHYWTTRDSNSTDDEWTYASVAIINSGGIRTSINPGAITFGDLSAVIPFRDTVDVVELAGNHLREILEHSISITPGSPRLLQVSGLKVAYNITSPLGHRVQSVQVLCNKCTIPEYHPLEDDKIYRVAVKSYLVEGGDAFSMIKRNMKSRTPGPVDIEAVQGYLNDSRVVYTAVTGRINILE